MVGLRSWGTSVQGSIGGTPGLPREAIDKRIFPSIRRRLSAVVPGHLSTYIFIRLAGPNISEECLESSGADRPTFAFRCLTLDGLSGKQDGRALLSPHIAHLGQSGGRKKRESLNPALHCIHPLIHPSIHPTIHLIACLLHRCIPPSPLSSPVPRARPPINGPADCVLCVPSL